MELNHENKSSEQLEFSGKERYKRKKEKSLVLQFDLTNYFVKIYSIITKK